MAAQSRLALRSSHRGDVGLGVLPATAHQQNPPPANTRKRTRGPSTDHDDRKSAKRIDDDPKPIRSDRSVKVCTWKTATRNVAAPASKAVTQVAPKPPTPSAPSTCAVQQPPPEPPVNKSIINQLTNGSSIGPRKASITKEADKRNLRSHNGGSRFKSELSLYFGDYDEVVTDEPKTQGTESCRPLCGNGY